MISLIGVAHLLTTSQQGTNTTSDFNWLASVIVPLLAASVPATIGVIVSRSDRKDARRAAKEAQESNLEMERLRLLERRVSERRAEAYGAFLPEFANLFPGKQREKSKAQQAKDTDALLRASNKFWHESLVYSSDEVQRAFARSMQGAFHDAPSVVTMRLFGELVIAVRRDMWGETSELTAMDVWAPKINDLFEYEWSGGVSGYDATSLPFEDLCAKVGWSPPWRGTPLEHTKAESPRQSGAPNGAA